MAHRIGDFLVQISAMTKIQVDGVLQAQKTGDTRLFGEIAIEFGHIKDAAILRYLDYLEKQR